VATGTLAVGGLTRLAGATVRFDNLAGAIVTTSTTTTNGILGPWAVAGSGSATRFATVVGGTIAPFTGGTVLSGTGALGGVPSGDTSTVNYVMTPAAAFATMGLSRRINTLTYTGTGGTQASNNSATTLTANGLLHAGSGRLTIGGSPRLDVIAGSELELVVAKGPPYALVEAAPPNLARAVQRAALEHDGLGARLLEAIHPSARVRVARQPDEDTLGRRADGAGAPLLVEPEHTRLGQPRAVGHAPPRERLAELQHTDGHRVRSTQSHLPEAAQPAQELAHLLEHDRLGRAGHAAGHWHAHDPRGRAQQCNPTLWVAALSTTLRRREQPLCFVAAERGGAARLEVFAQPRTRRDAAAERPRQRG
jgi:hypothetical protein